MMLFWLALIGMNIAAFAAFAVDKGRSVRGGRRIAERTLLRLALIGGSVGAIAAQQLLRHKTRKQPFRSWLWLIAAAQALAVGVGLYLAR